VTDDGLNLFEAWLRDELRDAGCEIRTLSPEGMAQVTARRMREQGWRVGAPSDELTPNDRNALVVTATERTLRTAAMWLESDKDSEMMIDTANAVKAQGADVMCCPVCEEVECDGDCPLAELRAEREDPR
jgi:hypothetical protein